MSAGRSHAAAPIDDPRLQEVARIIDRVVRRFLRSGFAADAADLTNEAWRACIKSLADYDPTKGNFGGYFHAIARRAVGKHVSRSLAPVSMGKHVERAHEFQAQGDLQAVSEGRAELHQDSDRVHELSPEAMLLEVERTRRSAAWREDVRGLLREALEGWSRFDVFIVTRLAGLDGHRPERPGELAERVGVDVKYVYRVHYAMQDAVARSRRLYVLYKAGEDGQE